MRLLAFLALAVWFALHRRTPGGGTPDPDAPGRPPDADRPGQPSGADGRPSQQYGSVDASAGVTSAQNTTGEIARQSRPSEGATATAAQTPAQAASTTDPTTTSRSDADLQGDTDRTPRPGEDQAQADARADAAQAELDLRAATQTYDALGEDPPRLNIAENDATHTSNGAHTIERHGPDIPLRRGDAPPGDQTVEGRIYGDPPWSSPQNWSYQWTDASTMNRTVNDYIAANWDTIRSDLALDGRHTATFDTGHRVGQGFYNEGMYGAGPPNAHYHETSHATVRLRLVPGDPPTFMVVTAFPSGLGQ